MKSKIVMALVAAGMLVGCGGSGSTGGSSDSWKSKDCSVRNGIATDSTLVFSGSEFVKSEFKYYGDACVNSDNFFHRDTKYSFTVSGDKMRTVILSENTIKTDGSYYVPATKGVGYKRTYDYIKESGYMYLGNVVYVQVK